MRFNRCHFQWYFRGTTNVLYVWVVVDGKESLRKSTFISVADKSDFNRKTYQIAGDPENTERLKLFTDTVLRVFREREILCLSMDPTVILYIALGLRGHHDHIPTIVEGLNIYLTHKSEMSGQGLSVRSISRYQTYVDTLATFVEITYGKDTHFRDLKPALQHDLLGYLKGKKNYAHNYALKQFQFFRSVLEYAVSYEWTNRNVLRHVRLVKYRKPVLTLSMDDLKKLREATFAEPNATLVRDIFLLSAYTGMAYSDMAEVTRAHIVVVNGVECLIKERHKTGVQAFIPIFPEARTIMEKYASHPQCLLNNLIVPVLSNVRMNLWLKVIGNTVGIQQTLTTHLGRRTFTMYAEELGFNLGEMAVILGHSNQTQTEQAYYQRRQEPVIRKFKTIFGSNSDQRQAG